MKPGATIEHCEEGRQELICNTFVVLIASCMQMRYSLPCHGGTPTHCVLMHAPSRQHHQGPFSSAFHTPQRQKQLRCRMNTSFWRPCTMKSGQAGSLTQHRHQLSPVTSAPSSGMYRHHLYLISSHLPSRLSHLYPELKALPSRKTALPMEPMEHC